MSFDSLIITASAAVGGLLGLFAILRRPRTAAKLLFGAGMLVFAAEAGFAATALGSTIESRSVFWMQCRVVATAMFPGLWLMFSIVYGRGNYREFVARWWPMVILITLAPLALAIWYFPELLFTLDASRGAAAGQVFLTWPSNIVLLVCLIGAVMVLMNLERTFRSALGTMRWRMKFTLVGLAVLFGERIYSCSQAFLFSTITPGFLVLDSIALMIGCVLVGLSIRRSGLFRVDVYPSHAFLNNSITAVLVGIYLLVVGVLAKLVGVLGSRLGLALQGVTVLVALAALGVLLFSDRAKQGISLFVSRHLRRPLYDYRRIWTLFTARTASATEPTELCRSVVNLVSETFGALSVTLWLVDDQRQKLVLGGSTALSGGGSGELPLLPDQFAGMVEQMLMNPKPIDIDEPGIPKWVELIRSSNPDHFQKGGQRICTPLVTRGELLGLLTVGDRISGRPFVADDLDLLTCVADQLANTLLNSRLALRVLESKQMEAFQTMSAFFVHDLKNTASTLSLMLQNLPIHFDNPEFRTDALRAVGKTVDHINDLIQRLSLLRSELEIHPTDADLNEVVESTLHAVECLTNVRLVRRLGDVPSVRLDRGQFSKVITNLLLNAREALHGDGGEIVVETSRQNGWVAVTVADNGCGMTRQFAEKQLFKPFQTTKKKGIGIGMFHSKMIVEAHRGRIEFETEQGVGTRFRVLIPLERTIS